ncbi:N-formylglutamate amidohydrolase [Sphingomonas desiccabilis]|uniref:N-formylglutamate amidohydrolase n=1 Tax=Sphingomonas desiccabilis TaxID=429134 RepID=A0A4V1QPW8_9SPHN|nr:N-formylglutamate amidohydrolase [Sphingomonas desiccabilis]MBB3910621.1 putative N-formylglutamate amidohydrolase [Sphingomonas desiccabilis]RXZ35247.1 N-formylglutamate amidohydrolase [Sphingomonas desiccabilis]
MSDCSPAASSSDPNHLPAAERIDGAAGGVLLLCDHASNHVPADIGLGVLPALLDLHIGYDIGAAALTRSLASRLAAPAVLGTVSRLVIDLHREPDHESLIPALSDGHAIPGNREVDRPARVERFHIPYHAVIEQAVQDYRPELVVAIHSFTPRLASDGRERPWQVGILYNQDTRAAHPAIRMLRERGLVTGDNEPYSGRELNATLNRHAEAHGIPSMSVEVRNDLIGDADGVAEWATILHDAIARVHAELAQ